VSEVFEIVSVGGARYWENDYGSYLAYPLDLKDEAGHTHLGVEWSRKINPQTGEARQPQVGEQVAGDVQSGARGNKLRVDYDATKELGGGSSGGGSHPASKSKEWKPESEFDPQKVARISRSAAQKVAVALVTHLPGFDKADDERRRQVLLQWIDFFESDVEEAALAKTAQGAGGAGTSDGPTSSPTSVATPGPAQISNPDEDIPF